MSLGMHVLSTHPLIIHGYNFGHIFSPVKQLAPYLGDQDAAFIVTINWSICDQKKVERLSRAYYSHSKTFPRQKVVMLANEPKEWEFLQQEGIPSVLCNQNAFLDERLYKPLRRTLRYNAVINARMSPYKRITLAQKVKNCCLITYKCHKEDDNYEKQIYGHMPFMNFIQYKNGIWSGQLNIDQLCEIYAQSGCGLILSPEEGACFAAAEYLLCGLPVVTTPNRGGRDLLFDKDYVIWCSPDADSVAAAVDKALSLKISPEEIRRRTVEKMETHRAVYKRLVTSIALEAGSSSDYASTWDSFFINKMYYLYKDEREAVRALNRLGVRTRFPLGHVLRYYHRSLKSWWENVTLPRPGIS